MRSAVSISILLMACGGDDGLVVLQSPPTVELLEPAGPHVEGRETVLEAQVGDRTTAGPDLRLRWQANGGVVCSDSIADSGGLAACPLTLDEDTAIRLTVTDADGETASDTLDLVVVANAAPTVTIARPMDGASLTASGPIALEAQLADADHAVTALTVEWTDNGDALAVAGANTGSDGQYTGVAQLTEGAHILRARVSDPVGASQTATVEVTVTNDDTPPSCTWLAPDEASVLPGGDVIPLSALVTDNLSTAAELAVVVSSSADGVLVSNIDASGAVTARPLLSTGAHTLTLTATDAAGLTCTATRAIEVCTTTWYADMDDDGFGDPSTGLLSCAQPVDFVADNTDCDDTTDLRYPSADELCDLVDNDCDDLVDDEDQDAAGDVWYADDDSDGFGDAATAETFCAAPSNYVQTSTDCDDTTGTTFPGAAELDSTTACHADADQDGYGDSDALGAVAPGTDCDDAATAVNPGATEVCNGYDDDCNTLTDDDDDGLSATTYYADADSDGFGDPNATEMWCTPPSSVVSDDTDCDDTSSDVFPGALEICDGVQNDCTDGSWANDDGLASFEPVSGPWEDWSDAMVGGSVNMDTDGTLALCPREWTSSLNVTADVSVRSPLATGAQPMSEDTVLAAPMTVSEGGALALSGLQHRAVFGAEDFAIDCISGSVTVADALVVPESGQPFQWLTGVDCDVSITDTQLVEAIDTPGIRLAVVQLSGGSLNSAGVGAVIGGSLRLLKASDGVSIQMDQTEIELPAQVGLGIPLDVQAAQDVSLHGLRVVGPSQAIRIRQHVGHVSLSDVTIEANRNACQGPQIREDSSASVFGLWGSTLAVDGFTAVSSDDDALVCPRGLYVGGQIAGSIANVDVGPTSAVVLTLDGTESMDVSGVNAVGLGEGVVLSFYRRQLPVLSVEEPRGPISLDDVTVRDVVLINGNYSRGSLGIVELLARQQQASVSVTNLSISNATILNNTSYSMGALLVGVRRALSTITVTDAAFAGIEATDAWTGVLNVAGSAGSVDCTGCFFTDLVGIGVRTSPTIHIGSSQYGAGSARSRITLTNANFEGVSSRLGFVWIRNPSTVLLDDISFATGMASDTERSGGHVRWELTGGSLTVRDTTFVSGPNSDGACVTILDDPDVSISGSNFAGCSSEIASNGDVYQGGIHVGGAASVSISDSSFLDGALGINLLDGILTGSDLQFSTTQDVRAGSSTYSFGPTDDFTCTGTTSTCTSTP